jgi:hypothetical protein
MRERIYSLETEYAANHVPPPGAERARAAVVVAALLEAVYERVGVRWSQFLLNGSRLYSDQGHAEWCLPECRTPREAAVYGQAADALMAACVPRAERLLEEHGFPGGLRVVKNNVDAEGNTYGCHENYMAPRQTVWLNVVDHMRLTVRSLLPFLVTRQVLCGAGRVGWGPGAQEGWRYQLSQRADFVDELVSRGTMGERAIVSLGREGEPFAAGGYRRLHLILGDANPSPWATRLKLGTTGVVLRMIEELGLARVPHLADPVAALRAVSRDPDCAVRLPLRDGRALTAVEVQRIYCEQAADYLEAHGFSDDEEWTMVEWASALDALDEDPAQLAGKADWVAKRLLLERRLEQEGAGWEALEHDPALRAALLRLDIEYHELRPDGGLHRRLLADARDLHPQDEVERARIEPPPHTRARIRGELLRDAGRGAVVGVPTWDRVEIGGASFELGDPLAFFDPRVYRALGGPTP